MGKNDISSRETGLETPILFLVFNRPEATRRVFEAIRKARPQRLYVAADGPRQDRPADQERCEEVRRIAIEADWPCEVQTLFRERNLGCARAVSGALDWFFSHEEEGIILEDDCLPSQGFFQFCEELLDRYRQEEEVMVISGNYFHGKEHQVPHSYFFSRYNHCWGWASWRRAWRHYDHEMSRWPELRESGWLARLSDGHADFQAYWEEIFDTAYADQVDSWAYRWTFACWVQEGLTVLPAQNLVKNIGFGEDATHTRKERNEFGNMPLQSPDFPLVHPSEVKRDKKADRWTDKSVFRTNKSRVHRVLGKIKRWVSRAGSPG